MHSFTYHPVPTTIKRDTTICYTRCPVPGESIAGESSTRGNPTCIGNARRDSARPGRGRRFTVFPSIRITPWVRC